MTASSAAGAVASERSSPSGEPRSDLRGSNASMKIALSVALGAFAGFAWHRLVGCRSGACPITASPIVSTVYGAMMGYVVASGG